MDELFHYLCVSSNCKWDGNYGATNARLNKPNGGGKFGAWSAKENNINQWLQVTFPNEVKVTAVGIQGRYDKNQWVTKFKVAYSNNGADFVTQDTVIGLYRIIICKEYCVQILFVGLKQFSFSKN